MIYKPCKKCGSVNFPKQRRKRLRNGRMVESLSESCVVCIREDVKERYHNKKQDAQWYRQRLDSNLRWQKNNWGKVRKQQKKWELRNADKVRLRKQMYYEANKERINERNRVWKELNRVSVGRKNSNHIWRKMESDRIISTVNKKVVDKRIKLVYNI